MSTTTRTTLIRGTVYDVADLDHVGWTRGDGSSTAGYHWQDYFRADGTYLGPDVHGIEPTFNLAASGDQMTTILVYSQSVYHLGNYIGERKTLRANEGEVDMQHDMLTGSPIGIKTSVAPTELIGTLTLPAGTTYHIEASQSGDDMLYIGGGAVGYTAAEIAVGAVAFALPGARYRTVKHA